MTLAYIEICLAELTSGSPLFACQPPVHGYGGATRAEHLLAKRRLLTGSRVYTHRVAALDPGGDGRPGEANGVIHFS
jgi:hypothetical protein